MRIAEMSTDKMFDVLAAITPEIGTITSDKEFMSVFKEPKAEGETRNEFGLKRIILMIPYLLTKHRQSVYKIISVINDKKVEEISNQQGVKTIKEISEILNDEELMSFFR